MPDLPLVTIVTPSYNQAEFLEYTIQSVLAQDYCPVEYIVIDGASTDGSVDIIQRYAGGEKQNNLDRPIWWISERDSGQAEAINKGLKRAHGEIIAWLNSDDLYLPGAISQAVACLQANPDLGMVFADAITIDAQGRPLNRLGFGDWGLAELMGFRIICQPAVFMRRSILEKAGFLDPTYHFMLDHHLWLRMAQVAPVKHARYLPLKNANAVKNPVWAASRHHPAAKNISQATKFGEETLRLLGWIKSQPDLASAFAQNRRRILGGAYRLNARYLLDGGKPWEALLSYARALAYWPTYTLKHWHRMAYAMLCLLRLEHLPALAASVERLASKNRKSDQLFAELRSSSAAENWPGLDLAQ